MCNTEAIEKNTFECMEWMENNIKGIVTDLLKISNKNVRCVTDDFDREYFMGVHDGLLDVLHALNIETNEEYYN